METELVKVLIRTQLEAQLETVNKRIMDLIEQIEEKEMEACAEDDPKWTEIHAKCDKNTENFRALAQKFTTMTTRLEITRLM